MITLQSDQKREDILMRQAELDLEEIETRQRQDISYTETPGVIWRVIVNK